MHISHAALTDEPPDVFFTVVPAGHVSLHASKIDEAPVTFPHDPVGHRNGHASADDVAAVTLPHDPASQKYLHESDTEEAAVTLPYDPRGQGFCLCKTLEHPAFNDEHQYPAGHAIHAASSEEAPSIPFGIVPAGQD